MPIEDVATLVDRWQATSGVRERVGLVRDGAEVLRGLPDTDRETLAQALVDHGAPDLADRVIEVSGGHVDADDLQAVSRAMLFLDRDQLRGITADLRDPEGRAELVTSAQEAVAASWEPPAPGTHLDDLPSPPTPPDAATPPDHEEVPELDHLEDEHDAAPADEVPDAAVADEVHDATPEVAGWAPQAWTADRWQPSVHRADQRSAAAPVAGARAVAVPVATASTLAAATTARERFHRIDARAGRLTSGPELCALLDTIPPGWQRRRAARRLIATGDVHDVDVADLFARLERRGDRRAVGRDLILAELASADEVTRHLDPADGMRLARRYG